MTQMLIDSDLADTKHGGYLIIALSFRESQIDYTTARIRQIIGNCRPDERDCTVIGPVLFFHLVHIDRI